MIDRIALLPLAAIALAAASADAAPEAVTAPQAMAIARQALPGSHVVAASFASECNTPYWFVKLTRGHAHYMLLASAQGKVLRIAPQDE